MESEEETRRTRVLVLASSALDRRALSASVPNAAGLELVAVCASISAARDRLRRERVDVLAVDAAALEPAAAANLRTTADERGVFVIEFASAASPEHTSVRVLEAIERAEPREPAHPLLAPAPERSLPVIPDGLPYRVVAIGSSTGGPDALGELIPRLPASFPGTVLIAQHMPPTFTSILAGRLEQRSQLAIHEARNGEPLGPGKVLIAPGDYHLELAEGGTAVVLHHGPPENSCRPSVDVLFRSVAQRARTGAMGIVLTGMGRDGLEGARLMRRVGFPVFVQDEQSSVVWGMPGLIAREGLATRVGTIAELARYIIESVSLDGHEMPPEPVEDGMRKA